MYKEIILKAFEKGKKEIPGKTTKTQIADHISVSLLNDYKIQISGRTLRNLFDDANNTLYREDISINSEYTQVLCKYLGYEDYTQFLKATTIKNDRKIISHFKRYWILILVCFITISSTVITLNSNEQRWMIWDSTGYKEVHFDKEKYSLNQLKLYDENSIKNFHKTTPSCDTVFFNQDTTVRLWYGKNTDGNLEYFTSLGLHPQTNKTLKPITPYMIKKYICNNY